MSTEPEAQETPLDPAITPELFQKWRAPRFGQYNPERLNNPVWEWRVRSKVSAYQATQRLGMPSSIEAKPGWCFSRFGQSSTQLPDGRTVLIAGEHEDHYDPDFNIYNDVVVLHPNGKIEIFGYPAEIFPPNDFHSATLVGDRIVIIGSLGYPEQRKHGTTPVTILDLRTFAVLSTPTYGKPPGWLHSHEATLTEDGTSIVIRRGILDRGDEDGSLVENIDDWKLHLSDWRWERLTDCRWQRWEIVRKDRKPNHLWEIREALWSRSVGWDKEYREQTEHLKQALGSEPDLDLAARIFCPSVAHEQLPWTEDEYNIFKIKVNGIVVRFVEDMHCIQITVEGDLPEQTATAIATEFAERMSVLENTPFDLKKL